MLDTGPRREYLRSMKYETTWWVALHGQAIRIFVRPSLAEAEAFIASEYGASWAGRGVRVRGDGRLGTAGHGRLAVVIE